MPGAISAYSPGIHTITPNKNNPSTTTSVQVVVKDFHLSDIDCPCEAVPTEIGTAPDTSIPREPRFCCIDADPLNLLPLLAEVGEGKQGGGV